MICEEIDEKLPGLEERGTKIFIGYLEKWMELDKDKDMIICLKTFAKNVKYIDETYSFPDTSDPLNVYNYYINQIFDHYKSFKPLLEIIKKFKYLYSKEHFLSYLRGKVDKLKIDQFVFQIFLVHGYIWMNGTFKVMHKSGGNRIVGLESSFDVIKKKMIMEKRYKIEVYFLHLPHRELTGKEFVPLSKNEVLFTKHEFASKIKWYFEKTTFEKKKKDFNYFVHEFYKVEFELGKPLTLGRYYNNDL